MNQAYQSGKKRLGLAGLLFGVFALSVYAGMQLARDKQDENVPETMILGGGWAPDLAKTLSGNYLASHVALMREDYATAAQYAHQALDYTEDADQRKRALRLLVAAGDMDKAERLAFELKGKNDPLAMLLMAGAYIRKEEYAEAEQVINALANDGLYEMIRPVLVAWVRAGQQKSDVDLDLSALEKGAVPDSFAHYNLALIYDYLAETKQVHAAYAKLRKSKQAKPFRVAQVMANYYLRQGELDQAKAVFADYAREHPDSGLKAPPMPEAVEDIGTLKPLIDGPAEGVAEIYFTLASLLYGTHAEQETVLYLQLALALRPDLPPAQMLLASLFEQQDQHDRAVSIYRSIDEKSVFYREGRVRIALNYHAAGQVDEAIDLLRSIVAEPELNAEAVMLLGDMLRREKAFAASVDVFKRAQARYTEGRWGWRFFYKYGQSLERNQQWEQAEAMFTKALDIEPEQPDVLNYLGYSWLEQGVKLEKAKEFIELAYIQEPEAAHIIDSMGWAYYKLGDYDRALSLIERAASSAPHDATVNDHLGDVYWRLGRKREARFQWQRALEFEPEAPEAVRLKLEQGLQ